MMAGGRPTKYTDELLANAEHYLEFYNSEQYNDVFPSIAGLALALSVSRSILHEWAKDPEKPQFLDIYEELLARQEKTLLNGSILGDLNPTISKLMLTKHGYSDKMESETVNKTSMTIKGLQVEYVDAQDTDS